MPCSKGMVKCHAQCLHRDLVQGYRAARIAYELERERVTLGYATEIEEYAQAGVAPVTFKNWLYWCRRPDDLADTA